MPEIHMSTDEARLEMVPVYPCSPYGGTPRHTPQRTLHGVTSDLRHGRPHSTGSGQSSRARQLKFVSTQRRREENDGLHMCVTSIEALEPDVGDGLQRNTEEGMEGCPLTTTQNIAVDTGAAIREAATWSGVSAPVNGLQVNVR